MSSNHLRDESSPYLRQHADNPVEWYPWGPEALERARREDKPILLSIGYSACHWCHVMAHESFEDANTAAVMNANYINIKVDREERPDLDKIYQTAHQLLTGRGGGWPLTLMLMPDDHTPFFAGTYFPPQPRHGLPSFVEVLNGVAEFFRTRRADLAEQNTSLRAALSTSTAMSAGLLNTTPMQKAREALEKNYDADNGGFGRAPKFPHPGNLDRLLTHWSANRQDSKARDMALHTLRAMARGGIYDHIGGGFCRYSVDERWMIPHFEKMLYDNGPLLALYADAWRIAPEPLFKRTAEQTAAWMMREMQSPDGGYYSTLDADSEHEEGKFYVWTPKDVRAILKDPSQYELFARYYGLHQSANFEGHWHLHVVDTVEDISLATGASENQIERELADARAKLFAAREQRVRPGRDEKILTAWNGLAIKGMARAGRVFGRDDFIRSAERALEFARKTLWRDGRLLATFKDGRARLNAYLDDYAFLADGVLELLQARWRSEDVEFARALADVMLAQFEDKTTGGFFFTAHDHEKLLQRPKNFSDDALPSGNGVATQVLLRMGSLYDDKRYTAAAERALRAGWEDIQQFPHGCDAMLAALDRWLTPPQTVVIRGSDSSTASWRARCARDYAPHRTMYAIPPDATHLPAALAPYVATAAEVTAYVCTGTQCSAPVTSLSQIEPLLTAMISNRE